MEQNTQDGLDEFDRIIFEQFQELRAPVTAWSIGMLSDFRLNPHLQEYGYYEAAKQCVADVAAWAATLDNKAVKEGMVEYIALFNKAEMYLMQRAAEALLTEAYSNGEDFNRWYEG